MYYPDEVVEEVRSRNDIVDVISGYVHLQKKGSSYFGLCPFHNEKTGSFSVSPGKQMFYCFGCGTGGNVFTFLMKYENCSFAEAVEMMANRAGITLPERSYSEEDKKRKDKREKLLAVTNAAATYYYRMLRSEKGKPGYQYLVGRKLTDETMQRFGLGFAGISRDLLATHLRKQGFADEIIRDAGLAVFDEKRGLQDKFWNRVMFPIQDVNRRVIGFGGRVMGDGEPKYLNSPETPIFDKSRNLYGLHFARSSRKKYMILCEGYLDVISMHQAGFSQTVASLGTSFTLGQANLLKRYTDEVLLAYDSDGAGVKAALRAIGILRECGMTGRVIDLSPAKDPDEFLKSFGADAMEERLAKAENSFMFELRMLERDYDMNDPESKTKFQREIARKLCGFSEEAERENYIEAVADQYHIRFEGLRSLVTEAAMQTGMARPVERPKPLPGSADKQKEDPALQAQRSLLSALAEEPALYDKIKKWVSPDDFSEGLCKNVATLFFADLEQGRCNPAAIISTFEEEDEQRQAAALFQTTPLRVDSAEEKDKALHDILYQVKKQSFDAYCAAAGSDVTAISEVIRRKNELETLRRTIK